MAAETEVERLVVRLTGDGSQYQTMLRTVKHSTEDFAKHAISLLTSLGVAGTLKGAFEQFAKLERGQIRLRAAIEGNGQAVEPMIARYQALASAISGSTLNTKGDVLAMLQQAEMMGMTGDAAERMVRNSIALGAATGREASGLLSVTAAMERGNYMMLRRLPGLRGIKDETELVAKANQMMATGMKVAEAEFNSSSGRVERLGRSMKMLGVEIGAMVASVILPVIEKIQHMADSFKKLDPAIQKVVAAFATIAIAATGIAAIQGYLAPVLGMFTAIAGFLSGPFSLAILAVVATFSILSERMGGLGNVFRAMKDIAVGAWEKIKEKGLEFINWMSPVADALRNLFSTSWEDIAKGAEDTLNAVSSNMTAFSNFVQRVWSALAGRTNISWGAIRDYIVTAILFAEYTMRHFDLAWSIATTSMALNNVRFMKQIQYFFQDVIPAIFNWFTKNWRDIFLDVYNFTATVFMNMGMNIARVMTGIFASLSGEEVDWSEVWQPLLDGFVKVTEQLVIPPRVIGGIEQELMNELAGLENEFGQGFDAFLMDRMAQIPAGQLQNLENQANLGGHRIASAMTKGAKSEMGKLEAALYNSAEAISRLEDYVSNLFSPSKKGGHVGEPEFGHEAEDMLKGGVIRVEAKAAGGASATDSNPQSLTDKLLVRIAVAIEKIVAGEGNVLAASGFAEE